MTNKKTANSDTATKLTAEVVSIGDEMTSGARLDTNAQWLSRRLGDLGVEVIFHSTVGDTLAHNIDVFRTAASRADVVVATGGLGPTRDDLTREALAAAVDQPLELRESALQHIQSMFAKRDREMPQRNQLQAMFPAGSQEIFNPQGTAPGVDVAFSRPGNFDSRVFALPGVPAEMKRMFDETVAPRILQMAGSSETITHAVMKFFGTGESDMEQRLGDMISRDRQPRVGITVSTATISLRVSATAANRTAGDEMIAATRTEILQRVGDLHFGDGEHFEQYHAVDRILRDRNESLVIVELGNAAPLGDWFASLGRTSAYRGGVSLADQADLVEMAEGVDLDASVRMLRNRFKADWLLLVSGYPELDHAGDTPLPAAEVVFTVVTPNDQALNHTISMGGHPSILQQRIGKSALHWLRTLLAEKNSNDNN
ncbi:competence/damage-inducible protein A [Planctomycetes bacterium K23_9]|uniref:Competence-damage inducible protein n=1 Tax=Stieleria marina TaxID=1930275 RepID=A0A517NTX2_9BACT|nr:Putative competence-damage inducible protein [Planctomycetes bacterium K23_9]